MEKKTLMILLAVLAVLLLILYLLVHFSKGRRKGRAAERKVAGFLKKLGKKDKIRIINNAYLPLYRKACEIDHLVFGRFGVLVIETKGISGSISGSGKYLEHRIGAQSHKFYNPQFQNKTHIDNVVHHLKRADSTERPSRALWFSQQRTSPFRRDSALTSEVLKSSTTPFPTQAAIRTCCTTILTVSG